MNNTTRRARCGAALALLTMAATTAQASPPSAEMLENMQRLIDAQHAQLKAQQDQLHAQARQLQALEREVGDLKRTKVASPALAVAPTQPRAKAPRAVPITAPAAEPTPPESVAATGANATADWPGSFAVPGTHTRAAIHGYAKLSLIHDTSAITSPCDFVTADIVTGDATKTEGSDGQTNFCVKASRLSFETRTPTEVGRVKTFVSMDFFDDNQTVTPQPRLRQAYGELSGLLFGGDLLAGQASSTFTNPDVLPATLDFEGPNGSLSGRQPLLRWTQPVRDQLSVALAVETPDNSDIENADALTRLPNGVLAAIWKSDRGQLKGSGVLRDLRASADNGPTETALGWGVSGSGKIGLPFFGEQDNVTFQVNYGEGIGSYLDDSPPDAVMDAEGSSLTAIPVLGAYVGLEHWWMGSLRSTAVYGRVDVDNQSAQGGDSLNNTQYVSANLVWSPFQNVDLGAEYLWGKRRDEDGASGTDNRVQLTSKFRF